MGRGDRKMGFFQHSLLCGRDLQEPNLCLWDGQSLDGKAAAGRLWVCVSVWEDEGWAGRFFLSVVCVCLLYRAVISQRSMVRVKIAPKKVEKNKIKYENKTVGMMLAAQPWT